jgi:hypothetical protein
VLAAELARLDTEQRDSEFFTDGGPLDFSQTRFAAGSPASEPRHSVGRKLAIGVAALVVLALVGVLIVTKVFSGSGGGDQAQLQPPSKGHASGAPAPPAGQPTAVPLTASQVRIVDPQGDRTELKDAGNMVDGDSNTAWETQHYRHSANFGNTKPGMGVLIDLGAAKKVSLVKIDFTTPGATVQLKSGNTAYPSSSDGDAQTVANYTAVGSVRTDAPATTTLLDGDGKPVRYLLVWITSLPQSTDQADRWQVGISEIQVLAS